MHTAAHAAACAWVQAFYYKFKASYQLGVNSTSRKKKQRIKAALKAYDKLKRNYPDSKYLAETEKLYRELQKEKHTVTT